MAFADEQTRARLVAAGGALPSDDLLKRTRADGYALSNGYTQSGVKAIAAPVFDMHGKCAAAVSQVVPEFRFDLERFRQPLIDAAAEISRTIQGK